MLVSVNYLFTLQIERNHNFFHRGNILFWLYKNKVIEIVIIGKC